MPGQPLSSPAPALSRPRAPARADVPAAAPPALPKIVLLLESSRASGRALLAGIADYAHHHGPWSFYWEPRGLEKAGPILKSLDADGIILRDTGNVGEVLSSGIPAVVVGHSRREIAGLVNVVTDSEAIGRMAADHLLQAGFQNFGYCGLATPDAGVSPWSRIRGESFAARARQAGFETHFFRSPAAGRRLSWKRERQVMAGWLRSLPKPAGVMACNDDRGQQVIEAAHLAGLQIPDDIAVIGADNDELVCGLSDPPLSSVAINFHRAGYESAECLDRMLRGDKPSANPIAVHASHVVMRRSTNILAVEDPFVARALRFMRDHVSQNLAVTDVARAAGLSRRALEKRFRRCLNRSILTEIRRLRVDHIAQLLAETSRSIAEIADQLDFDSPQHIARYFRAVRGITPREFRRRRHPR